MRDVEIPRDAHSTVQLHSLFAERLTARADKVLDRTDSSLGFGAAFCNGHGRPQQQRLRLLAGRQHIDHAVLQSLETADRDTKLRTALGILDRLVLENLHDTDGLGTNGQRRVVDGLIQRCEAVACAAKHGVAADANVLQSQFGCTQAVDGVVGI